MKLQKSDQNRQITLVIDCAGMNYFVTVVITFMNDLLEIGIDSQTKVIYTYK